jgi:hypothetical protein
MGTPPPIVNVVMECVVAMLDKKPKDWEAIRTYIRDPSAFLKLVQNFDVTTMTEASLTKIRANYFKNPEFNTKFVTQKS